MAAAFSLHTSEIDDFADLDAATASVTNIRGPDKIHLRIQQRNGRKCVTTVAGLANDLDVKRICKAMRRKFNVNGSVEKDDDGNEILQLQGDQRENVKRWLIKHEIIAKSEVDCIVIHGS